jgi:hypothetical protein
MKVPSLTETDLEALRLHIIEMASFRGISYYEAWLVNELQLTAAEKD